MKVRNVLGLAVAVPSLVVAFAQPGHAAARGVVTFAGTVQVQPTALPQQQTLDLCFSALAPCLNGAETFGGMAAGAGADLGQVKPDVVDAAQATAEYSEACAPATGIPAIGHADLSDVRVRDAVTGQWSQPVSASWTRAGLVAVIQSAAPGDVLGAALFTPAGLPACGVATTYAVTGAVELAY